MLNVAIVGASGYTGLELIRILHCHPEVAVAVSHIGTTSFTTATGFRIAGEDRVVAVAETVRVLMDPVTMTKLTIPDYLRLALERGAPGVVVDHAGYVRP